MQEPIYGIVGRGRVATHIARYLELEAQEHRTWHRGMAGMPADALAPASVVLLAISDDALEPFLLDHPKLSAHTLVHFSGSKVIAGVTGMHPLMTFGPSAYDFETYRSIPFVVESGGKGFDEVFPALRNPFWTIEPDLKPLYHALCVLAGNFPALLWSKAIGEFEDRLGLPREVLGPYLAQTLENTLAEDEHALTGPLARGDARTVQQNITALGNDAYAGIYRAFAHGHGMLEI
ncbi:MAG: DUF2520 domain-containing protein [Lysobacterales bacterium]|jgi:predicted short-subunit dehydrogenase-like oxidoreductase (DUF2520 family)